MLPSFRADTQIRDKFEFHDNPGFDPKEFLKKVRRKTAAKFRSPWTLINFLLPITREFNTYNSEKFSRDFAVGATMATLMIPQVGGAYVSYFLLLVTTASGLDFNTKGKDGREGRGEARFG